MLSDQSIDENGEIHSVIVGSVARVRWSRINKRNAFNSIVASRLSNVLEQLSSIASVTAVVLQSEGPVFCAGWDLDEIAGVTNERQAADLVGSGRRCLNAIDQLPQVVITAVEGAALGFGVALLAHSDVTLVSTTARLLLPELHHGIVPASVLGDLVARVGRSDALRWCLRGEIPIDEALASGLVTELIEPHVFEDAVNERVQSIAVQVPAAVQAIKRLSIALNGDYSHVYEQGDTFAAGNLLLRGVSR